MKNTIIRAVSGLALCISLAAHAGIPVAIDADPMRDMQWMKDAENWIQTAKFYSDSMQNYKEQLASQTGLRDVMGLVNQARGLKDDIMNLQKQGISLDSLLTSSNAPTGALNSLYEKYKDFDVCDAKQAAAFINTCKQETVNKAWMIEQTNDVQEKVNSTLDEISTLTNRVAGSQDAKESQDLANSIQLKSVQLNTITTQWEMNMKAADQRAKLLEQKRQKAWNNQQLGAPVLQYN